MLLYLRFYISTVVNSFDWTFSTVNSQPKIFFFTVFLFRSCCLCVFLFIHSFRLSLPWNSPRSSRKNDCVHCLSSCTVWSLSFLSGLSLYWNNIFIENSFCVVLSKSQRVKLLGKSKRRRHWNLPFSETNQAMVSLKQSQQYSSTTPHTLALYIHDWHSYAAFLFIYFLNQPTAP